MASSSSLPFLLPLPHTKPTSRINRGAHFPVPAVKSSSVGDILHHHEEEEEEEKKKKKEIVRVRSGVHDGLTPLYDDGYGSKSLKDYYDAAREVVKSSGGPPRWFCPVECGQPIPGSPLLLFLPDIDGTGMGLILHHKSLGKVFEVRCLHIPLDDRTPFDGLVKFVENLVKQEHALSPNRPIYLLGDSFGGCLALAVAIRNPSIDLVLVLVNPATSYNKSMLQPYISVLEALPPLVYTGIPYVLSLVTGAPLGMATTRNVENNPLLRPLEELLKTISSLIPLLSDLTDTLSNDTLLWKLKLLKSGASYANSRLHAVEAPVLIFSSGKDNLLPSGEEADRLWETLKNCKVRYFKDGGHSLLLEDGFYLLTMIKGTLNYRRSRQYDFVTDYLPPSMSEFRRYIIREFELLRFAVSPAFFSTLEDGRIVRGLGGVPNDGPVLFVGYHMLMGLELYFISEAFLREKNNAIRSLAHPYIASQPESSRKEFALFDGLLVFGGLPVSPKHIFKLFSAKSSVLLYPGGAREAHHRKGEEYKLFWPEQPEFVRMAARFGATIVPFGVIGEDDIVEMVMDYDDQMKIPFLRQWIEDYNKRVGVNVRADMEGEVANQDMYFPLLAPKVPGRFYFLFGKPIETRGMGNLKDRDSANKVYSRIKSDVEGLISYLKEKREEDPYRSIVQRIIYLNSSGASSEVPSFEP